MPDSKITALTSIGTSTDPANDPLVLVDVSDTSMAATGTTKKVTLNNLLSSSPTATGAFTVSGLVTAGSATITGDLTVDTNVLKVDSANNRVGIGTASPATTLDVRGANNTTQAIFTGTVNRGLVIATRSDGLADDRTVVFNAAYSIGALGQLAFQIAGSDKMLLDYAGNLGLGVTPSAWNSSWKAFQFGSGGAISGHTSASLPWLVATSNAFINSAADFKFIYNGYSTRYLARGDDGTHSWWTSNNGVAGGTIAYTQAMTLTSDGNLLVGTTNTNPAYNAVDGISIQPAFLSVSNTTGVAGAFNRNNDGIVLYFTRNGTAVGNVSVTTTGTTFNSTSDYRLKEAVAPLSGGLARVNALKPSVYKWKANGSAGEGFLAHELAEVVPAAVTGEKDAVNSDGSIKAQSIDMSRVVPILVAAIQELTARVQTLETR